VNIGRILKIKNREFGDSRFLTLTIKPKIEKTLKKLLNLKFNPNY
jgi:hypothetical protein